VKDLQVSRKAWIALGVMGLLILAAWAFAIVRASNEDTPSGPKDSVPTSASSSADETGSTAPTRTAPGQPTAPNQGTNPLEAPERGGSGGSSEMPNAPTSVKPAAENAPLEQIMQPPAETVWAFKPGKYTDGARIEMVFRPYGTGPSSIGESVVVLVSAASPTVKGQSVPELVGRNVVLVLGSTTVAKGGTYEAVGAITTRGDRSVIVLQSAKPRS